MKKILLLAVTILTANAFTQTIPNNDFESWTIHYDASGTVAVDSLEGGYFTSGNPMAITLPSIIQGLPTGFMYDTTFAQSGLHAVAMRTGFLNGLVATGHFFNGTIDPSVAGIQSVLATLSPLAPATTGVPSTATPSSFGGYFFYQPGDMFIEYDTTILENDTTFNKSDTCKIACLIHKWNTTLMQRDTIAYGEFKYSDSTTSFTPFNIDLNYNQLIAGDSISLLFLASAEGESGFAGSPGTLLIVDSIYFSGNYLDVKSEIENDYQLYSYNDYIVLSGFEGGEMVEVYDLHGRLVNKNQIIGKGKNTFYIEESGIFIVSVSNKNRVILNKKVRIN